jgi:hypothetical protein
LGLRVPTTSFYKKHGGSLPLWKILKGSSIQKKYESGTKDVKTILESVATIVANYVIT